MPKPEKQPSKFKGDLTGDDRSHTPKGKAGWDKPEGVLSNQQVQLKEAIALAGKDPEFAVKFRGLLEGNGQLVSQIHLSYKLHLNPEIDEAPKVKAPKVKAPKKA